MISKNKNLIETSEKINKSMGNYFILLSEYEKILKEEDINLKKEKMEKLFIMANEYCKNYPKSSYKKDIEKLINKLENIKSTMQ